MMIVIEGADGSGKSTQAQMLAARLGCFVQRFPDRSTPIGKLIDSHLRSEVALAATSPGEPPLILASGLSDALMFQCMMVANRLERAAVLLNSKTSLVDVVCDRYSQSGIVYGSADGLDFDHMVELHALLPEADVNVLIDVPAATCHDRLRERGAEDRYERKRGGFLDRVVEGYRRLWKLGRERDRPSRWAVVDGTQCVDDVHDDVVKAVKQLT